jgi:predicted nuclease of predicted toxin-antitoxin system
LKFKLDENLSPALAGVFSVAGHEAHSILEQSLGGKSDAAVIEVCARESRALVTLDLDFANIQQYPPAQYAGIVVLRLASQSHREVEDALGSALKLLEQEPLAGRLWIVEPGRIRIHE